MKPFPVIAVFGGGALITGIAASVGIASTIELKLLIFINTLALMGFLLRKHLGVHQWFYPSKKVSPAAGTTISNTSWFVTNRLGLKRVSLEESGRESTAKESRMGEAERYVTVVEAIDPVSGAGKVKYKGMNWRARSLTRESIAMGERVVIVARDVLTLVVERMKKA
jgi:membrane-bound ClpP family serine protease